MNYEYHELPNGIRVVYSASASKVSHLGVYINAGSRDEQPEEQGIAHFIEHMAFKGTIRRKAFHILSRLDNVGGDMNAFTTKEHTCLYASFLSEYTTRAVDLFADIILNSTFPEKEIVKEKTVILDEINSYKDSPSDSIYDDFEDMIFSGHPLGTNILGTPETVNGIRKQQIIRFIQRNYTASETVVSYVGSLPLKKVLKLLEHFLVAMPGKDLRRSRIPFSGFKPVFLKTGKEIHQTHAITGTIAYPLADSRKTALYLLTNLLGGPGSNSRLNMALRERRGYTYHVESNYQPFSDTGYFNIYLGTTTIDASGAIAVAYRELEKLKRDRLGGLQLHRAKAQLSGQIALTFESKLHEMLSIGKRLLNQARVESLDELISSVERLNASELLDVANDIFRRDAFSTLIYQPNNHDQK